MNLEGKYDHLEVSNRLIIFIYRRHIRPDDQDETSEIERAILAIKNAAKTVYGYENISLPIQFALNSIYKIMYMILRSNEKLDLKAVFHSMDTSGDGFININEMISAFQSLGVKLTAETADALFRFDFRYFFDYL
jgi:hypothetical protein